MHKKILTLILTAAFSIETSGLSYALRPMSSGVSTQPPAISQEEYPEHLEEFKQLADLFSKQTTKIAEEITGLLNEEDTLLFNLLEEIKFQSYVKDLKQAGESKEKTDRRSRSARELILGQVKNLPALAEDIPLPYEHELFLDQLAEQILKVYNYTLVKLELKTNEEKEQIAKLSEKINALLLTIGVFRSASAVLRNSEYFPDENFDKALIGFMNDPKKSLMEKALIASSFMFIKHTVCGINALFIKEASKETPDKSFPPASKLIRASIKDSLMLTQDVFAANISLDLCLRYSSHKVDQDMITMSDVLWMFVDEGAFVPDAVGRILMKNLTEKIIEMADTVSDDIFIEMTSEILARIDPIRALQIVKEEVPDHMPYFIFSKLETGLMEGFYDPGVAKKIKEALKKKLSDSQWPKMRPKDLAVHIESERHNALCRFLLEKVNAISLQNEVFQRVFKAYYPDDEKMQPIKLREAFDNAYKAIASKPRHLFLFPPAEPWAFEDEPIDIQSGHGQTISQPSLVYQMTALLNPKKTDRALEIGTGGGYQASILSGMVEEVHTIEIYGDLAERAQYTSSNLGIKNIRFYKGDGSKGLADKGPFDIIVVTAGAPVIPEALLEQLSEDGGRLLIPEEVGREPDGRAVYSLVLYIRQGKKSYNKIVVFPESYWVPLMGEHGYKNAKLESEAYVDVPVLLEEPQEAALAYHQNTVPVITPFKRIHNKIAVDREGIRRLIKHLISIGVRSVLVMGATGEFMDLTNEQRMEAIRIFAEESRGRLTIFANATAKNEKTTLENIEELNTIPFISAIVIAPLVYFRNNKRIFLHVKNIHSELPILLYNNPGIHKVKGSVIQPIIIKWLSKYISGIKDSSGRLELLGEYAEHVPTYQGNEWDIINALGRGAVGAVSSMGNCLPFSQDIFEEGKTESEKGDLQDKIREVRDPLTANLKKIPSALKYYLWLIGVLPSHVVKDPDKVLDESEKREIEEVESALKPQEHPELLTTADLSVIDKTAAVPARMMHPAITAHIQAAA